MTTAAGGCCRCDTVYWHPTTLPHYDSGLNDLVASGGLCRELLSTDPDYTCTARQPTARHSSQAAAKAICITADASYQHAKVRQFYETAIKSVLNS